MEISKLDGLKYYNSIFSYEALEAAITRREDINLEL